MKIKFTETTVAAQDRAGKMQRRWLEGTTHDVTHEFGKTMVRLDFAEEIVATPKKKAPAKKKTPAKKKVVVPSHLPEETQDIKEFEVKTDEVL